MAQLSRSSAFSLLHEHVKGDSLRKHCLAVAAAMESYASVFNEDADLYWITGLLHDFDYEKYPNQEHHPFEGVKILKEKDYPDEIIQAILSHAEYSGAPRLSHLAKSLFAVDELSGLLMALAKVRPNHFEGMNATSVEKAIKKKDFAAAINRSDIARGIAELDVKREEHFQRIITALAARAKELGF